VKFQVIFGDCSILLKYSMWEVWRKVGEENKLLSRKSFADAGPELWQDYRISFVYRYGGSVGRTGLGTGRQSGRLRQ
jgi:hypothetical protein